MAIQNVMGDSFRGATWVSIHNGGGVGWGEVINGGFGLTIDGSPESEDKLTICYFGMLTMVLQEEIGRETRKQFCY